MIGIIGCLAAVLLVMYLCYINWSIYIVAIIGALVAIILNSLPVMDTFYNVFFPRMGSFFVGYFSIFLFGSIKAYIYSESGAAISIADSIMKLFLKDSDSANKKQVFAILIITAMGTVLAFGGIITTIVIILLYPLALAIFEKADIPKRFILGILAIGTFTFALTAPGSPQVTNIVAMKNLGTSSTCALIPGIVGAIVELIVSVIIINKMINRAKNRGEHFAYGPKDVVYDDSVKKPNIIISVIPIVVLFILFNVFKVDINICLVISSLLSLFLFRNFLKSKGMMNVLNTGAVSSLPSVCTVAAVVGFASVVSSTDAFMSLLNGILGISLPPMLLLIICVALMCALTGGSATGLTVCLPIVAPILISQLGMAPEVVHRVGTFAATTADTLPKSGAILMFIPICNMKLSEVYPPAFATTVIASIAGTFAVALLLFFFPVLA